MSIISFENAVKTFSDTVYRVSLNILKNPEDSKDVMQNVFLRYFKHQQEFKSEEHIKAWLIRVAVNESKRYLKINSRNESVPLEEVANSLFAENKEGVIFSEVMSLDEKYRTVILLYYYEGYDVKEIARILRRNAATVRTQLSRARELLKSKFKEDFYE